MATELTRLRKKVALEKRIIRNENEKQRLTDELKQLKFKRSKLGRFSKKVERFTQGKKLGKTRKSMGEIGQDLLDFRL